MNEENDTTTTPADAEPKIIQVPARFTPSEIDAMKAIKAEGGAK